MASLSDTRNRLRELGLPTETPGLRGEDRLRELRRRLRAAGAGGDGDSDDERPATPQGVIRRPRNAAAHAAAVDVGALSMTELRQRLLTLGVDSATPGVAGDARKQMLAERLREALAQGKRPRPRPEPKQPEPEPEPEPEAKAQVKTSPLQSPARQRVRADQMDLKQLQDEIQTLRKARSRAVADRVRHQDSGLDVLHHELRATLAEIERLDDMPDARQQVLSKFLTGDMDTFEREDLITELIAIADDIRGRISEVHAQIRAEEAASDEYGDRAVEALAARAKALEAQMQRTALRADEPPPPMMLPASASPSPRRRSPSPSPSPKRRSPSPPPKQPPPPTKLPNPRHGPRPQPRLPDRAAQATNAGAHACQLQQAGDLERANEAFLAALRLDPEHRVNTANYALFLDQHWGDADGAEQYYRRATAAPPDDPVALSNFACFLARTRLSLDEAGAMHQRAVAAGPAHPDALGNWANFLKKRGELDRAAELYERALAAAPEHDHNLSAYAGVLKKLGRLREAETAYERALAINPGSAKTLANYANFLSRYKADLPGAKHMYHQALEIAPDDHGISRNYAIFLRDHPEMRDAAGLRGVVRRARGARGRRRPSTVRRKEAAAMETVAED